MNKTAGLIVIVAVVLGACFAGWYWGFHKPAKVAEEKARQEQLARQAAEQKRKEDAARKKAQYDQLIVDADGAFDREDWQAAQAGYSQASSLFPNEQYPADQLTLVTAKLDELAALEARKAAGIVDEVATATGRYYVIVSSSIDGDLAMDYASKLAKEGTSVKVVAHEANALPFYGVSVGDYNTWDEAATAASSVTGYENGGWVLKF